MGKNKPKVIAECHTKVKKWTPRQDEIMLKMIYKK